MNGWIQFGTLTFESKSAFIDGQGAQPAVSFETLSTWNTCDTFIIRWRSLQKPDQVQDISIGIVQPAKEGESGAAGQTGKYQIKNIFPETAAPGWTAWESPSVISKFLQGWETEDD
jgi:hypothetical protein